ncbi:hypothetical protein F4820DRAFT_455743 [Hypoxylon rubiginosum]|uniref:Uncharacterized protein n=1 Tax=Hypoxylon rubiginosum TaxID=110542 RepID=A0ACB9ZDA0_9PEZI|nr:hypothetical protein F4820DRAFT_455743 [Hypoxylon rubiginosum]
MANPKPPPKKRFDLVNRGEKKPTPSGTLTFIGLRALDLPLQHALLAPSGLGAALLSRVGLAAALPAAGTHLLQTGLPLVDALGHPTAALLLAMAAGSCVKQVYWLTALSAESFPPGAAVAVSALNTAWNGLNTFLFLALATTSLRSRPLVSLPLPAFLRRSIAGGNAAATVVTLPLSTVVGTLMYVAGIALEAASERQRKAFKDAPENAGKVCKVGVWRWARHVNYLGYALWRGGYTMAATGWVGGLLMTAWQVYDLSTRAGGVLDEYCAGRYKEQWFQYKREVPYKIIPGIY